MSSIEYLYSLFNLERGRVIEEEEVEETGDDIFIVCCNGDYNMVKKICTRDCGQIHLEPSL
jgi:hypothetical protein